MGASKKRRWTSKVEEPLPDTPHVPDSWRNHPRLQRHARSYKQHENHGKLLEKYAKDAAALDRKALLRCICHVGAWVALLPIDDVLASSRGKSPALLLVHLLRMRGTGKLSPWLHGVLRLVAARLPEIETRAATSAASSQLLELRRSMPSRVLSEEGWCKKSATDKSYSSSVVAKRARFFHNETVLWNNCDMTQRYERVHHLEARVVELKIEMNTVSLRVFLRQAVAALSPPHLLAQRASCEPLEAHLKTRLMQSACLQTSIRDMLIWGLDAWRNMMNLEDEQICHLLMHIQQVITDFEEQHGDIRNKSYGGKQWELLKSLVMTVHPQGCSGNVKAPLTKFTPLSQKSKRSRSTAKVEAAAFLALQRLGNEATARELIDKMRSDKDIWSSIAETANRAPSKGTVRMKNRKLEAWEANTVAVFPQRHCVRTEMRRGGLRVYRLRS